MFLTVSSCLILPSSYQILDLFVACPFAEDLPENSFSCTMETCKAEESNEFAEPASSSHLRHGGNSSIPCTESLQGSSSSTPMETSKAEGQNQIEAQNFTFQELAAITNNFIPECFVSNGLSGRLYIGNLEKNNQVSKLFFQTPSGFHVFSS